MLDINGDLTDQNRRSDQQQGEGDQVIQHSVTNSFAKSIRSDVADSRVHGVTSTGASVDSSFSRKDSSNVARTGINDTNRKRSRRRISSAASCLSSPRMAR